MRFSVRELLILTGCLAGYVAFLVAMFRGPSGEPDWLFLPKALLPLPLVVWLGRRSYLREAGRALIDLRATPNRAAVLPFAIGFVFANAAMGWMGHGLAMVLGVNALLAAWTAAVWRRCRLRERGVFLVGQFRKWEDQPVELIEANGTATLWFPLGSLGGWPMDATATVPSDRVEEVRAILAEKQPRVEAS